MKKWSIFYVSLLIVFLMISCAESEKKSIKVTWEDVKAKNLEKRFRDIIIHRYYIFDRIKTYNKIDLQINNSDFVLTNFDCDDSLSLKFSFLGGSKQALSKDTLVKVHSLIKDCLNTGIVAGGDFRRHKVIKLHTSICDSTFNELKAVDENYRDSFCKTENEKASDKYSVTLLYFYEENPDETIKFYIDKYSIRKLDERWYYRRTSGTRKPSSLVVCGCN